MKSLFLIVVAVSLSGCAGPALIRAAATGHDDEVNSLLASGDDINQRPVMGCWTYYPPNHLHAGLETPLICATINHQRSTVKLLLEKGADVNARDHEGKTALDYARSPAEKDDVIAAMLLARQEGRPHDTAAAPSAAPAKEPEPEPAKQKQWYDK
jgi:ankyrin repeat protein